MRWHITRPKTATNCRTTDDWVTLHVNQWNNVSHLPHASRKLMLFAVRRRLRYPPTVASAERSCITCHNSKASVASAAAAAAGIVVSGRTTPVTAETDLAAVGNVTRQLWRRQTSKYFERIFLHRAMHQPDHQSRARGAIEKVASLHKHIREPYQHHVCITT